MGRDKRYDRKDVLDRATRLFWREGYRATSMADIVRETGLNTASMYKEFGDKDGLFERALEYYREHIMAPRFKILTDAPNIGGVKAFLASVVDGAVKKTYTGCLMMNHLAQKHSISREAVKQIDDYTATMEGLLETALRNAQADGDLPPEKDPAGLASYIMCCVHGLVLYGRHEDRKSVIPQIYDTILRVLRA